jgi:hypothetical protein
MSPPFYRRSTQMSSDHEFLSQYFLHIDDNGNETRYEELQDGLGAAPLLVVNVIRDDVVTYEETTTQPFEERYIDHMQANGWLELEILWRTRGTGQNNLT